MLLLSSLPGGPAGLTRWPGHGSILGPRAGEGATAHTTRFGGHCVQIHSFQLTPFFMNCFVIEDGGEAVVIDPGEAHPRLLSSLEGLQVKMVVDTHCHIDHCAGNAGVVQATSAPLVIHEAEGPVLQSLEQQAMMFGVPMVTSPAPDRLVADGDTLQVGDITLTVRHAPGHSPGHIVLIGDGFVCAGDVLFAGSIGRTDLPGGSHAQLLQSIRDKLLPLPDDTVVHCGHGPDTTIGRERQSNPFLVGL